MRDIWKVIVLNIAFYVGVIFDKFIVGRYGYDYIIDVMLYMILAFSSIVFEESILIPMFNRRFIVREKIKNFIRKSSFDRKQFERSF